MRKMLMTTVAVAALGLSFSGMAWSQTGSQAPSTTPGASGSGADAPSTMPARGGATIDAEKLIGRNVENKAGEEVGEISTVVLDKSGQVKYVVVGVGGFLGMGQREVAMQWNELKVSPDGDKIVADVSKEELQKAPEYKYDDPKRRGTIYTD